MFLGFTPYKQAVSLRRKMSPIAAYCGPNGSGKSLCMVMDGIPAMALGLPILSTVRPLDVFNPRACDDPRCPCDKDDSARHRAAYSGWIPWRTWGDFLEFEPRSMGFPTGEIWADEMTGVAASQDHASLPSPVADKFMQLRRAEIVLRYTSPAFARADKRIREVTQTVTICRGFMGRRGEHAWVQNRAFLFLTFDARQLDEMDLGAKKLHAMLRQITYMPAAMAAYDTFDQVQRLDSVHLGTCLSCGGRITQPRCECGDAAPGGRRVLASVSSLG